MSFDVYFRDTESKRETLLVESGRAVEYYEESKKEKYYAGAIFKGQVMNVRQNLDSAFVDVGGEILMVSLHGKKVTPQSHVLCMLESTSVEPGKKRTATTDIALYGRYVILKPFGKQIGFSKKLAELSELDRSLLKRNVQTIIGKMGCVFRSGVTMEKMSDILRDAEMLVAKYERLLSDYDAAPICSLMFGGYNLYQRIRADITNDLVDRVFINVPVHVIESQDEIFLYEANPDIPIYINPVEDFFGYYGFSQVLENRNKKIVRLPHGGNIVIEQTRAMTVIDVNSQGSSIDGHSYENNNTQVNIEACAVIAYELRLRNIGGIVVIDFISMQREENRTKVVAALQRAFDSDRFRVDITPVMSPLGLCELSRIHR